MYVCTHVVPLRDVVDPGPLVYLDRTAVDVDDIEADAGQFSSDLPVGHDHHVICVVKKGRVSINK